ncbi:MAG: CoA transferase [Acetobacteraceae bacterium]|nr:CoA transferase [Pseudomonadota bacterium]
MLDVQALQGTKVLDIATFLAGPFCATQLGEFGADVIKIELPGVGDATRRFGTMTHCGDSLPWLSESRNKRCITLDLRKPDGAALLKRLVADSDVLVENFQTGTLEKWGLGYDVLSAVNPRLIMVRITGYGQTGPYKDRPGFGRIGNAFGGLSFLAGYPDRAPVTPGSATIPDYMAGLYGALGTLLALQAREKTGKGQVVDIGLYEPIFRILDELAPAFAYKNYVRQRMGPGTVNVVPHSHYPTKDGRWIAIACTNDKIFARLADAMNRPDLARDWQTLAVREENRTLVDETVAAWTATMDRAALMALCEKMQVPCGPVYSIDEIFEDPHYAARENILRVTDPRAGDLALPNLVPRLSDTPGKVDWVGQSLGAHNEEIYQGRLGLSDTELNRLRSLGVI